ncbi:MAG: radical SAM/SPASM domain-containing protein [Bacteroidota bacterium]
MTGSFRDSINFLSKITLAKVLNIISITISYYISRIFHKPILWGKPISLSIEPTTTCNLRCPECPSGLRSFTRPTGIIDYQQYKKLINEQKNSLSYLLLYFQGEPYLHPDFLKLVNYASGKGIYTATSTNAHFLTDEIAKATIESGLDRLIISIDGTTQDVYEQYRKGGSLNKVLEGTKKIIKWKKKLKSVTPYIIFQFLVVKPNEHQVDEVKHLASRIGVNKVTLKTAQLYDFENGNPLMPDNPKYSRYRKDKNGTYKLKNRLSNHCWKMWHSTVVTWDGKVVPCCFDKDATHQLGEIGQSPLSTIWQSTNYNKFRYSLLKNRNEIDICKNCTEGTKIWA